MSKYSNEAARSADIDWKLSDSLNRVYLKELCEGMREVIRNLRQIPATIEAELSESEVEHLARVVAEQLQETFDARFGEIERQVEAIHVILAEDR